MTLTAIYNQDEKEFHQVKKTNPIGFRAMRERKQLVQKYYLIMSKRGYIFLPPAHP
jgi:hypothetical protein